MSSNYKMMIAAPFLPEYFETGPLWGSIALGWLFVGLGSFTLLRKMNKEAVGKDLAITRMSNDLNNQ